MKNALINLMNTVHMKWVEKRYWNPVLQKTMDPVGTQENVLRQILLANKDTLYGREHGFSEISSYEEFSKKVPVNDYESLRSYIENQESEQQPCLNAEQPVMYVQTSGTTGKRKQIPILKDSIARYRKSQHIACYAYYKSIPDIYNGKVLAFVSPAVEGKLETGTPYGSMSGLLQGCMPYFVRGKYLLSPGIHEIEDYKEKYWQIAKQSLLEKDITMIASANPSTLIKLDEVIHEHAGELLAAIKTESPKRARVLQRIMDEKGTLPFAELWPNLKAVMTWTGGSCKSMISVLKKKLPLETRIVEMGYLSSEFRGSLTVDALNHIEIPVIDETFYEFVEKADMESPDRTFLTLGQLVEGEQYYIFATTRNGLYRYDINDIVKVTGRYNNTPAISFVQKGRGVISLTGEKLHEFQLVEAMKKTAKELKVDFHFFVMLGCPEHLEYTLYVEHAAVDLTALEHYLNLSNIEFEAKRKSGRLKPLNAVFLREGTGERYKQHCLSNGQREGQYKVSPLQLKSQCSFNFSDYARD